MTIIADDRPDRSVKTDIFSLELEEEARLSGAGRSALLISVNSPPPPRAVGVITLAAAVAA